MKYLSVYAKIVSLNFIQQKEIAQLACDCERHIGTQSGGMDQVTVFCFVSFIKKSEESSI